MKVTDIRRKLIATLAAGGLIAPVASHAANLDVNLVVNGEFEDVDFGASGNYGGPTVLNWDGMGFVYSHDGSGGVPNYANGAPLASGGSWYFAPGSSSESTQQHHSLATAITQTIDVSSGPSGTLIASGYAGFNLSAYFNSFATQTDHGVVQVDFLDPSNAILGTASVTPGAVALTEWTQVTNAGSIPAGASTVRVSSWAVLNDGGGADGYTDNIDFRVSTLLPNLLLTVNRATGVVTLANLTGGPQNLSSYSITSAFEALAPASWLSITDNYDSGNPGPNQVDSAHAWTEQFSTNANLTEAEPATVGASLANGRTINLGAAWIQSPVEDLVFQYVSGGETKTGLVNYVGQSYAAGDLNVDGAITAADWTIFRTNFHTDLSGRSLVDAYRRGDLNGDNQSSHADFVAFKTLYDSANGAGAFAAMVASVPEPASLVITVVGGLILVSMGRRSAPLGCSQHGAFDLRLEHLL